MTTQTSTQERRVVSPVLIGFTGMIIVPFCIVLATNSWDAPDAADFVRMAFGTVIAATLATVAAWWLALNRMEAGRSDRSWFWGVAGIFTFSAIGSIVGAAETLLTHWLISRSPIPVRAISLHREQNAGRYSGAMTTDDTVSVRAVRASDFAEWAGLYRDYRAFYALSPDESIVENVWTWINDSAHEVNAFVASSGDRLVGLAHYRRFARPSTGSVGIFLDDLFTSPNTRGSGVGRALLSELSSLADDEGSSVVRWITAEDNTHARRLYDSTATSTKWVTYDLTPGSL